ncbi:unnamed protein product [Prorocentrum cordatum]|uniref:Uncharacterized protein n=1 Tax=Prorocentrum cordatum TaxID=2364126 RepID=A0ABN9TBX8_9DINO|nr:unnamed protein product [Polarella glacialis]
MAPLLGLGMVNSTHGGALGSVEIEHLLSGCALVVWNGRALRTLRLRFLRGAGFKLPTLSRPCSVDRFVVDRASTVARKMDGRKAIVAEAYKRRLVRWTS